MDLSNWLRGLGLERYEQAFRDNDIDVVVLRELTADDLVGLGVRSVGHRRRLLAAIAALRGSTPSHPPPREPTGVPERRQVTVLFCDLVGSTALSSRLDPEEMREVIRAYQAAVLAEVQRFAGHVLKLMGDGVLACFGHTKASTPTQGDGWTSGLAAQAGLGQYEQAFRDNDIDAALLTMLTSDDLRPARCRMDLAPVLCGAGPMSTC